MLSNSLNSPRSNAPKPTPAASRKNLQLGSVLGRALLHQAQALTKDLASILVTAGADQSLNDFLLMFRQNNVSSRHR